MKHFQSAVLLLLMLAFLAYILWTKTEEQDRLQLDYSADREMINIELPAKLVFCGEPMPLKEPDVRERFEQEMHRLVYARGSTLKLLGRAERWLPQIEEILLKEGLPPDFKYMPVVESMLDNAVSPRGAAGFWQIMEETGRQFGLEINEEVDERFEPVKATRAACRYLKQAHKDLGNWTLVAASYNRGINGIERALTKQQAETFYDLALNTQTAEYVYRILAFKELYENQEKYSYTLRNQSKFDEPVRFVTIDTTIANLTDFALSMGISYKTLVYYNPWILGNSLNMSGRQARYQLVVPLNDVPGGQQLLHDPQTSGSFDEDD